MGSESHIELDGVIIECGRGGAFKVRISEDHTVNAKLSGKMRKNKIRIVLGDKVKVKVSPYDPARGFITFRVK